MKKLALRALASLLLLLVVFVLGSTVVFHLQKNPPVEKSNLIADSTFGTPQDMRRIMTAKCDAYQDAHEITHLKSPDPLTLWACLGKLHGRDRGWQIDYFRRVAWGRTAEILGGHRLTNDIMLQLLDFETLAKKLYQGMSAINKAKFQAYAYGINAGFLENASQSYEFKDLGYLPEVWLPHHSVMLLVLQSFSQTRRTFERDLLEQRWAQDYGLEAARELLDEAKTPWFTPILNADETNALGSSSTANAASPAMASGAADFGVPDLFGPNSGSNSWIIDPTLSTSRKAWVVNDPHVHMLHPPFWHWVHLDGPEFNLFAGALPGAPVFATGTNGKVGWGLTNSFFDVADVIEVKQTPLAAFRPVVWIKWGFLRVPFFFRTFSRTPEGYPVLPSEKIKVLRWAGYHLEPKDIEAIFEIPLAQSARQSQATFAKGQIPSWNFIMADEKGDIAYQTTGKFARRDRRQIGVAQTEHVPAPEWLPASESPRAFNPRKHYIVTANQRHFPDPGPLWAGRAHYPSFRGFRITEKIEERIRAGKKFGLDDHRAIACDLQSVDARFIVPKALAVLDANSDWNETEKAHLQALREWNTHDYLATEDCRACGIYQLWMNLLMESTGLDEVAVFRALTGVKIKDWNPELLIGSFKKSVANLGPVRPWGEIHINFFNHLSGYPGFATSTGVPTGGSEQSVSPGSGDFDGKVFRHTEGASQRLFIEMSSPPKVYLNLVGMNLDHEKRDLQDPQSPYQMFRRCEAPAMEYPLAWEKIKTSPLTLALE